VRRHRIPAALNTKSIVAASSSGRDWEAPARSYPWQLREQRSSIQPIYH
jgi:hypothetical protein